ncbi:MmgE/PrpD family protein [Sphingomonas sp. CL5.1]|uniref:MmgE/PrpD family protein n=1 Tax=Sphingomonas sp. CL5.1 TaxID=2653203 RepID=UPI0015844817|nr:MmgE/PrpD family protein [Sphingomonas sp. CL5.1]QKS00582.1 MmgE/PrpD family protein [Sphingomonas sp. CL5.1]
MSANAAASKPGAIVRPALEEAILDFIEGFSIANLTDDVRFAARRLMQDQIANQVACSQLPWSVNTLEFARSQARPGVSTVTVYGDRMSAIDAAFVNATFGHAFEYDDAHRESASHPGACVVPAALAMGEETGASADETLAAMVVGYEVYTRIGSLAAPELLSRGYHPHCMLANFGAAAIAARLMRLGREQTGHALAIAMSHASGTTEYTSGGGSIKRVHSGIGASGGIRAAQMAAHGITGPVACLTGGKGFYRTFLDMAVGDEAAARFGRDRPLEIGKAWFKPYLCCGCIHAYIDAVAPYAGRATEIEGIDVRIQRSANVPVGTKNANAYAPTMIEHVQYSLPVQLAFTLLGRGNGYQVHRDAQHDLLDLSDQGEILRTARKVRMTEDPELDLRYPGKFVADVTLRFADGSSRPVFVEDSTGTIENPMSQEQLDAKFRELAVEVLGIEKAEALLDGIRCFGGSGKVADFTALLVR